MKPHGINNSSKERIQKKALCSWLGIVVLSIGLMFGVPPAYATTDGQTTFYFHAQNSDSDGTNVPTHNVMTLTPPMETTMSTSASSTTTPAFGGSLPCESGGTAGGAGGTEVLPGVESVNIDIDTGSANDRCIAAFYSMPVGQSITVQTSDTLALTGTMRFTSTNKNGNQFLRIRFYKFTEPNTYTQFGTLTDATTIASNTTNGTRSLSGNPGANVTINAGDRIVALWSLNMTSLDGSGLNDAVNFQFDDETDGETGVKLLYTLITPSKPDLTGSKDDDFTTAAGTTACSAGGVAYNTKWTCLQPSGTGEFNAHTSARQWIFLNNVQGGSLGTNFNTTPSNTYMYQSMDTGDPRITTVINSPTHHKSATPFSHGGLLLWTSNTDYLILQVHYNGTNRVTQVNDDAALLGTGTLMADDWGRVWLRWTKSGTNFQASMSTDGSTFENVGSAISHGTAFTRMGMTVYSGTINTEYGAAFEYFDSLDTSAPSAPSTPQCEATTNPTGVVDLTPEFDAVFEDANSADTASAYQIEVNTISDFTGTIMWNSGKVTTSGLTGDPFAVSERVPNSGGIAYAGTTLTLDGTQYFWRIRFWDAVDNQGTVSATQNFTMFDQSGPGNCICPEFMILQLPGQSHTIFTENGQFP